MMATYTYPQGLCALRLHAGLTQQRLADRLSLSRRTYSYWERYPVALCPEQLLQLAEALRVSVEELMGVQPKSGELAGLQATSQPAAKLITWEDLKKGPLY